MTLVGLGKSIFNFKEQKRYLTQTVPFTLFWFVILYSSSCAISFTYNKESVNKVVSGKQLPFPELANLLSDHVYINAFVASFFFIFLMYVKGYYLSREERKKAKDSTSVLGQKKARERQLSFIMPLFPCVGISVLLTFLVAISPKFGFIFVNGKLFLLPLLGIMCCTYLASIRPYEDILDNKPEEPFIPFRERFGSFWRGEVPFWEMFWIHLIMVSVLNHFIIATVTSVSSEIVKHTLFGIFFFSGTFWILLLLVPLCRSGYKRFQNPDPDAVPTGSMFGDTEQSLRLFFAKFPPLLILFISSLIAALLIFDGFFKLHFQHRENFEIIATLNFMMAFLFFPLTRKIFVKMLKLKYPLLVVSFLLLTFYALIYALPHERLFRPSGKPLHEPEIIAEVKEKTPQKSSYRINPYEELSNQYTQLEYEEALEKMQTELALCFAAPTILSGCVDEIESYGGFEMPDEEKSSFLKSLSTSSMRFGTQTAMLGVRDYYGELLDHEFSQRGPLKAALIMQKIRDDNDGECIAMFKEIASLNMKCDPNKRPEERLKFWLENSQ